MEKTARQSGDYRGEDDEVANFAEQWVMKTNNFSSPKHGAVTYLTKDELNAIAKYWNVELKTE